MAQSIFQMALVVHDYDEAIEFYKNKLRFELLEDTVLSSSKRWVVMCPPGGAQAGCRLLLAKAAAETQTGSIGNQTGGRVFLFLKTDRFTTDYQHLLDKDVKIIRGPVKEAWGTVAVFADLYGNPWDLIGD